MAATEDLALIHAEIDGELDARQRGQLAARLLADPEARRLRDGLQGLCAMLDEVEEVEPPVELRARILEALPPSVAPLRRSRWSGPQWRYAALAAGVLGAAVLVLEMLDGQGPASTEVAGTMADGARATLDTVLIGGGPVAGSVSLYRDRGGLGLTFAVVSAEPLDVLVASGGHTQRVSGVGTSSAPAGAKTTVPLSGFDATGPQTVNLTFLSAGREVGRATLSVPEGR
jgi:hypothetical protein